MLSDILFLREYLLLIRQCLLITTMIKTLVSPRQQEIHLLIRRSFPLFFLLLMSFSGFGRADTPVFADIQIDEIDSLAGVFAIAQDNQGFLWFAGKNGLRRYDGHQVQVFRHNPNEASSLSSNDVSDLLLDSRGQLWVATLSGGGLNRFDPLSQSFVRYQHNPDDPHSLASNNIYAMAEDSHGDLWLASHDSGLIRFEQNSGKFQRYNSQHLGLKENSVRDIAIDRFDTLWVAGMNTGLYRLNLERKEFSHYQAQQSDEHTLSSNHLFRLYIDQYDNVWIGTADAGLNRFERDSGKFIRYQHQPELDSSLGAGLIWDIAEDSSGQLYVATGNGALNRFNKWQNQFQRFYADDYATQSLTGQVISMFRDTAGDLWLGTYNSNLNRITERAPQFTVLQHNPTKKNSLLVNSVSAIVQDSNGYIWFGSTKGLSRYHTASKSYQHYVFSSAFSATPQAPIRSLEVDKNNHIWIGTAGDGVYIFDVEQQKFTRPAALPNIMSKAQVWDLFLDHSGMMWIGTQQQGLFAYDTEQAHGSEQKGTRQFVPNPLRPHSLSNEFVWTIYEDSQARLWIGTQVGLNLYQPETGDFKTYGRNKNLSAGTLVDDSIRAIAEDASGALWLASPSALQKLQPVTGVVSTYRTAQGLADDNITALQVDDLGFVWLATQKGLARLDTNSNQFQNYDRRHGTASNAHPRKSASLLSQEGMLYFAGTEGITGVNPQAINRNLFVPPVVLTDIKINAEKSRNNIQFTEAITLKPSESVFSIGFAALNYLVPEQNQYAYRLQGFDRQWQYTAPGQHRATYTNLDPGQYTFLLKGSNNEGLWNPEIKQLHIRILPHWWSTYWANFIFVCLLFSGVYFIYRANQQNLEYKRQMIRRLTEDNQFKSQFIANISDELEPPLNAILGLSQNLLINDTQDIPRHALQQIRLISDNAQIIEKITSDAHGFSTSDSQQLNINRRPLNIEPIITSTLRWFQPQAEKKSLRIYQTLDTQLPHVLADFSRLQQILFSLIDNALKYTRHGYIEVKANVVEEGVKISVVDTGSGMNKEELQANYAQDLNVSEPVNDFSKLGLDLINTRLLIELHGAHLQVKSQLGQGSSFSFVLPVYKPGRDDIESHSQN